MRPLSTLGWAAALALAATGARAEALTPADAQDPAFAAASRARPPALVWHAEAEREEIRTQTPRERAPQRHAGYRGLVLPGDGRALVAVFEREALDSLAPGTPGKDALYFRAIDAAGRPGARIPLGNGPGYGMLIDRGNGAAAVLGRWRDGTVPLVAIAAHGPARETALKLAYKPLRLETNGTGFLVWLDRAGPFHLERLDGEGRAQWSFEYPRGHYGFLATAARADGFTLAVLNEGPLKSGILQDVAALLLDRAGRRVGKRKLELSGHGGPVPTGLHALKAGGFLLTGFWWGPGGNFVAWLDGDGRLLRFHSVTLGDFVEVQSILPLGDEGFLATDGKGQLLRFDRDAKLLWRFARPARPAGPPGREEHEVSVYDLRVLAGNELLLAGARTWYDNGANGRAYVTSIFLERYRFD